MSRVPRLLPLLAACALALAFGGAGKPHFTLGILRADGLLVPFASYDGGWSVPWPTSLRNLTLPISLRDVQDKWWGAAGPEAPWTAVLRGGEKRPLALAGLRQVRIFCTPRVGVQTNYAGSPPAPDDPTVVKDGVAVAGDVTVLPVESVPRASPDWTSMARRIANKFDEAERDAANGFTSWKHPYSADERRSYPIQLEAFYRSNEQTRRGAWRASYVEAVRTFPVRPEDKGCGLITYAFGWVLEQAGKEPRVELRARVTYCDRDQVSFMQPFGRFALGNDVYWVYQLSSWRDEAYIVSRIRPDDVDPMVIAEGGNCPRR